MKGEQQTRLRRKGWKIMLTWQPMMWTLLDWLVPTMCHSKT